MEISISMNEKGFSKYQITLFLIFIFIWILLAINPKNSKIWLLENIPVIISVPVIVIIGRKLQLSNLSFTLFAIFIIGHLLGAHYTYADIPLGKFLGGLLGTDRNMYDRIMHFSFGLFVAFPLKEIFSKSTRIRGFWSYLIPLSLVFSLGALYELIEWAWVGVGGPLAPEEAASFLALQGDPWDAQKDIFLAFSGGLITMILSSFSFIKKSPSPTPGL